VIRRGEVRLVDFEPVLGSEANKRRPAVVVSNDRANAAVARVGRGLVTVVPLTSNVSRVLPFQVLAPSAESTLRVDSKIQCEQVRSVSSQRVSGALGALPAPIMQAVDAALRLHLDL
jgi:mRNA interferase MazF